MYHCLRDLNMTNASEIPDNYLYQPPSSIRHWMEKRGKKDLKYYSNDQIELLRKYFNQLDVDGSGTISPSEIEETLISLGLARSREDVEEIIGEIDQKGSGELDFEEFLTMLKDMSMKQNNTNYLKDRSILYKKQTLAGAEFEELKKKKGEFFPPLTQD